MKIDVKPLSINSAFQGRRFKTPRYKAYEIEVMLKLPKFKIPRAPYQIYLEFGFSSKLADWDNPVKLFVDILQKKYGFDDRDIYRAVVVKTIVKKGEEFIKFKIEQLEVGND